MPRSRFVTAWAATQSQMFLVRTISQVTRLNQTSGGEEFAGVHQHGNGGADDGGGAGERAEGDGPPSFADDEAHQEAAEEELFDDRDDEREAEEADGQECVGPGGRGGEFARAG